MLYSSICGGDKWREQGKNEGDISKKNFASLAKLFVHPPTFKLCFAPLLNAICYIPQFVEGTSGGDKQQMRGISQKNFARFARKTFCPATHFHAICYILHF